MITFIQIVMEIDPQCGDLWILIAPSSTNMKATTRVSARKYFDDIKATLPEAGCILLPSECCSTFDLISALYAVKISQNSSLPESAAILSNLC